MNHVQKISERNAFIEVSNEIHLKHGALSASVNTFGAELKSLSDGSHEYIWQGDPTSWQRSAPILFPVVGRVADGYLHVEGQKYPITIHGFASTSTFELLSSSPSSCTLSLKSNSSTLASFPYEFQLTITYELGPEGLTCRATISNPASTELLANFGFHPGFNCPLQREDEFAAANVVIQNATPNSAAPAVLHSEIPLHQSTFAAGPIIVHSLKDVSITVRSNQQDLVRIETEGTECLGLWAKPGADFICVEPWQGQPEPDGWQGEQYEKPYIVRIPPDDEWTCAIRVIPLLKRI